MHLMNLIFFLFFLLNRFYWKIVIDQEESKGFISIGINNPFLIEDDLDDYILCKDIFWNDLIPNPNDAELEDFIIKGYMYGCKITDTNLNIVDEIQSALLDAKSQFGIDQNDISIWN